MAYVIGVALFALGIGISLALHEAGHLLAAKAFGLTVRRYFITADIVNPIRITQ